MLPEHDRPRRPARQALTAALAFALALPLSAPGAARAADKTREDVIKEIAALVAETVKSQGQSTVCVSGFNNPFDKKKSSGAGIRSLLIEEIKGRGVKVEETAPLALTGTFRATKAVGQGQEVPIEQIDYVLTSDAGKELLNSKSSVKGEKPGYARDAAGVTDAAGSTVEVTPDKPKEANAKVITSLANDEATSTVVVEGTKIRPQKGSKFAIEILTAASETPGQAPPKARYKPTQPVLRKGLAYVTLAKDEYYAVNIINEQEFDIAAALTVDGIDMFQFSDEKAERTKFWIYKPGQSHPLFGWHRKGSHFDSFLVGEYSKDAAGKEAVDDETKLSQISVEFRAAWSDPSKMPADEGSIKEEGERGIPKTLRGPDTEDKNTLVQSFVGKFRARVTVRYDHNYPDTPK